MTDTLSRGITCLTQNSAASSCAVPDSHQKPSLQESCRLLEAMGKSHAGQQTDPHSRRSKSFACRVWLIHQHTKNSSQTKQLGATVTTQPLTETHLPKCRLVYYSIENGHQPWTAGVRGVVSTHCWVRGSLASGSCPLQL